MKSVRSELEAAWSPPEEAKYFSALLDAVSDCTMVVSATGTILAANRGVEHLFGYMVSELIGRDTSLLVPSGLTAILAVDSTFGSRRLKLMGRRFDGDQVELDGAAQLLDPRREIFGVVLREKVQYLPLLSMAAPPSRSDSLRLLEYRRSGPPPLTRSSAAAPVGTQEAATIELILSVTSSANQARTLGEALAASLELICHHFGWQLAHAYFSDGNPSRLRSTELWFGERPAGYTEASQEQPERGLPGRVLTAQAPLALSRAEVLGTEVDCAWPTGFELGIGFPVFLGGEVRAVVEAFSVNAGEVASGVLALLSLIGAQLGQVAEREEREHLLRAAMEEAESAGRQKAEFLSNMSHEFRTPMHAIINYTQLAARALDLSDGERARRCLASVRDSGKRLLIMLNDVLDLAKMEAGRFQCEFARGSFTAAVDRAFTEVYPLASAKRIRLERSFAARVAEAYFDEARMQQVLINLLSNAIKFSVDDGVVHVSVAAAELRGRPALECRVRDQGVGIPADQLESIFDKFEQSRRTKSGSGGTGLGLAICRQIIGAHGGTIRAENNPDAGAQLIFVFPLEAPGTDDGEGKR